MPQKLGQHFLKNISAIAKIIAALDIQPNDTIIEIGPGTGVLTKSLLDSSAAEIIAIEKDEALAEGLLRELKVQNLKLKVITDDILTVLSPLTNSLKIKNHKLVGNIPYYITGFLFRTIGELEHKPTSIVFTIQKEVAERLVAEPPHMNKLAASVQPWATPKIIMTLKPKDFSPPPKVNSAIISLKTKRSSLPANYYTMVNILFKQPRKTILNNLAEGLKLPKEKIIEKLRVFSLTGTERPGNLTIELIHSLSTGF